MILVLSNFKFTNGGTSLGVEVDQPAIINVQIKEIVNGKLTMALKKLFSLLSVSH